MGWGKLYISSNAFLFYTAPLSLTLFIYVMIWYNSSLSPLFYNIFCRMHNGARVRDADETWYILKGIRCSRKKLHLIVKSITGILFYSFSFSILRLVPSPFSLLSILYTFRNCYLSLYYCIHLYFYFYFHSISINRSTISGCGNQFEAIS